MPPTASAAATWVNCHPERTPSHQYRKSISVQQPGEGKKHDRSDVGGVALAVELLEAITQGKQQLRLGRTQVGRGEQRQAAWPPQPGKLGQKQPRILDVLDHLHRQGQIKAPSGQSSRQ